MDERLAAIAERLAGIEEELRELAYDHLADQVREPGSDEAEAAAELERRANRARRAIARAIAALGVETT